METGALVFMILGLALTWGGAAWCIRRAITSGRAGRGGRARR